MALKLRLESTGQHAAESEKPVAFVEVVVFDDITGNIIDRTTFQYDLTGLDSESRADTAKLARLKADAEQWGQKVAASAAISQQMSKYVGTVWDIPATESKRG